MGEFRLETRRLILRNWKRTDDAAALHAICTDPEVMRYLGPPLSRDEAEEAIERQRGYQASLGHCFWAIERKSDQALLGFCGLQPGPEDTPLERRMEIGWRFARHAWGQGLAREAAETSIAWGFANLSDPAIWAITVPPNRASWGLMLRLGMRPHPQLDFPHPDLDRDHPLSRHVVYSIERNA